MTTLRHAVGKSTLTEGITVPKDLEGWIRAPVAGEKREISILFDDQQVNATLRRLANARGHVQIKYENKDAQAFRSWLNSLFSAAMNDMDGQYLELVRVGEDTFRVNAYPLNYQPSKRLVVSDWIFHRTTIRALEKYEAVREIPAMVQSVELSAKEGQVFYNRKLSHIFKEWNWEAEKKVIPSLPLKCDFKKGAVQVEVEFGNARTYYQDYIKFMLAFNQRAVEIGVLIVPTEKFARLLCEVGRQRALAKGRKTYSGMIHLEKVRRELVFLEFMLSMPLAIAGVGANSNG